MKSKKLLARLSDFLGADETTQRRESNAIKKVLKALKNKERKLQKRLAETSDKGERAALQTKLDVIYAQRLKGVERIRTIQGDDATADPRESRRQD